MKLVIPLALAAATVVKSASATCSPGDSDYEEGVKITKKSDISCAFLSSGNNKVQTELDLRNANDCVHKGARDGLDRIKHDCESRYEVSVRAREIVSTISDPSLLDDPSTPQARAHEWTMKDGVIQTHPDPASQNETITQKYTLAVFYYSTDGDNWFRANDWLTSTSECDGWYGITCDHTGRIASLQLNDNNLAGNLPDELFSLTGLQHVDLSRNEFTGTISDQIGGLVSLTRLRMDFNALTGTLPDGFYSLSNLEKLDLSRNHLAGSISSGIGQLTSLTHLELGGNAITGTIPEEIGSLSGLQHVDLSCNTIIGMIPDQIGDLVSLTLFKLHENELSGIIPESGNSLRTWTLPAGVARRVQVSLRSPGRPIEASVELWQTPSYTPTKFTVECEDASENVVHAIVELPDGLPTTLAIYNTEGQEFPVDATVQEIHDGGDVPLAVASFSGQTPVYVEGNGAVKSFNFGPDVDEVEVLLTTSLRNMKAYVEILRGPNDDNEIINVETDDASAHPFYSKVVCAEGLNTLRIVNENTLEFPLEAYVRPFEGVDDGERPRFDYGGPYF